MTVHRPADANRWSVGTIGRLYRVSVYSAVALHRILDVMFPKVLILFFLLSAMVDVPSYAQADLLADARRAYEAGQWEAASGYAQAVLDRFPEDEAAMLLLARVELFSENGEPRTARKLLRRISGNPEAEDLLLWYRYRYGGSFLPFARNMARERATKRALESDSLLPVANLIAGLSELDAYRASDGAVYLPVRFSEANAIDTWLGIVDLELENGNASLVDREYSGAEVSLVYDQGVSARHREAATRHLLLALQEIREPGLWHATVKGFAELAMYSGDTALGLGAARRLTKEQPNSYWGPVLETLFLVQMNNLDEATASADSAMRRMNAEERREWSDVERISRPRDVSDDVALDDWLARDPRWSTAGNERHAEYVARMAMAHLLFGSERTGRNGWETDPGKVVVRYGMYQERIRTTSDEDAYLVLHYGNDFFVFHDMAKSGEWIFYSSSAADLRGPRSVAPQWERDFAIRSRERFDARPMQSTVDDLRTDVLRGSLYRLGHGDNRTIVAAYCMDVPIGTEGNVDMGLFKAPLTDAPADDVLDVQSPVIVDAWSLPPSEFGACTSHVRSWNLPGGSDRLALEADYGARWSSVRRSLLAEGDSDRHMSDLIPALFIDHEPATTASPGYFARGNRAIAPMVEARVASGTDISVYFEVDAWGDGTPVRIEAILVEQQDATSRSFVRRLFGRADAARVSVAFDDRVDGPRLDRDFILGTENVEPGHYVIAVLVTNLIDGTELEQSTALEIF